MFPPHIATAARSIGRLSSVSVIAHHRWSNRHVWQETEVNQEMWLGLTALGHLRRQREGQVSPVLGAV
jgi:hypothetical protein